MKYLVKFLTNYPKTSPKFLAGDTYKFDQKRLDRLNAILAKEGLDPADVYKAQEAK